ncbi:MAG: hypothetical protein AB1489_37660 [Acidobacteriota bacterium]
MELVSVCELCRREVAKLTRHHLIPRTRHKNKKNKKNFSREAVHMQIIMICSPCHRNIHAQITEKELEYDYNTREKLLAHPGIKKFVDWIKKRPGEIHIPVKAAKEK